MPRKLLYPALALAILLISGLPGTIYRVYGATLDTDRDQVALGQDLTITVDEPDANLDSRSKERISLRVLLITTDKFDEAPLDEVLKSSGVDVDHPFLLETDFNSGVFEVTLQSINDRLVGRGEDIRITYIDVTSSGAGSPVRAEKIVHVMKSGIGIQFSKPVYSPLETVEILLLAQMFNTDRSKVDTINAEGVGKVAVTSTSGKVYYPPMLETGANTGTFTGKLRLTLDPAYRDGDLVVKHGESISVTVTIVSGFDVSDSALVSSNLGSVSFNSPEYAAIDSAKVVVIDPDENTDSGVVDTVEVSVWSATDLDGLVLTLRETAPFTGIFEGSIALGAGSDALRILESDVIFARYHDRTVPSDEDGAGKYLIAAARVGQQAGLGLLLSEPLLLDQDGNEIQLPQVGRLLAVESILANLDATGQYFVYIVYVRDSEGFTVQLDWVTGTLEPFQSLKVARSWIPQAGGEYTIEVVAWDDLAEPSVLAPLKKIVVSVTE